MAYTKKFIGGKESKAHVIHDVNPYYSSMKVGDGSGNQISLDNDEDLDGLQEQIKKHKELKKAAVAKKNKMMLGG